MHILLVPAEEYVPPDSPTAGIFQHDQALALRAAGHRVGAISIKWGEGARTGFREENGVPVVTRETAAPRPSTRATRLWAWLAAGRAALAAYRQRFGVPDIVHAHNLHPAGMLAVLAARWWKIPSCITEHSTSWVLSRGTQWERALCRRAMLECDAFFTVSESLKEDLRAALGAAVENALVMPNVLDDEMVRRPFSPPPVSPPFRWLAVGNLVAQKDHAALLRAFAAAREADLLTVVGAGPLDGELRELARQLGIEPAVTFQEPMSRDRIATALAGSHALVLPSLYETFGVVGIEALACGRPVICTDSGGAREFVTARNGLLVAALDEAALAAALREARAGYSRFALAEIRSAALERFSPAAVAERLGVAYRQIAMRSSASSSSRSR